MRKASGGRGGYSRNTTKKNEENPFDRFANARKKHEVLNRRVKGEDRNVGRALAKAVEERKKRLLADYNSSKKSNAFDDRRFGEDDVDLSLEDKMLIRFQKERVKKFKKSSLFNLESDNLAEEIKLTHRGQVLGEQNYNESDWVSDDEDDTLDKDVVKNLHFGGGLVAKTSGGYNDDLDSQPFKRSRLDALQEIVAKSKLAKLQKKEMKINQEEDREKIDEAFEELVSSSLLDFRPTVRDRSEDGGGGTSDASSYDAALRSMAFEAKTVPTDRTKTAEEIALQTREKLEKLEGERLRRMKASYDPQEDKAAAAALLEKGSKAAAGGRHKKSGKRAATDDDIDDSFGAHFEEGDDDDEGDNDEVETGEDGEDDFIGEEDEEYDEDGGGNEDEDIGSESGDVYSDEDESDDSEDEPDVAQNNNRKHKSKFASLTDWAIYDKAKDLMPHKIDCPANIDALDELVRQYVRSDEDFRELITRILAWNSVHLPYPQGHVNKGLMHNFMDILLKCFVRIGDSLAHADGADSSSFIMIQLDFLTRVIFKLTQDISDACPQLWGRTLKIAHSRLQAQLRRYSHGEPVHCWPTLGHLLLLRLSGNIFSVTDYTHAVIGPVLLLLCQCLSQCPVVTVRDLGSGLLATCVLLELTENSGKFIPECHIFIGSTLALFSPAVIAAAKVGSAIPLSIQKTFDLSKLTFLRQACSATAVQSDRAGARNELSLPWTIFVGAHELDGESTDDVNGNIAVGILRTAHRTTSALLGRMSGGLLSDTTKPTMIAAEYPVTVAAMHSSAVAAFPELAQPLLAALRALRPQDKPALPRVMWGPHISLVEACTVFKAQVKSTRKPLEWRKSKIVSIESKNPRFNVDYKLKRDVEPDERKVKLKQLTKEMKREEKAAMRELRRDSDFLEQERFRDKQNAAEERREARNKNFAWMEEQQAAINQQVRKQGKSSEALKGGGTAVFKKARIPRR